MHLSLIFVLLLGSYHTRDGYVSGKISQRDDASGIPAATSLESILARGGLIAGVTATNDNMYVIRQAGYNGITNVEVYDLTTGNWTANLTLNFEYAQSMASSTKCNRLYIVEEFLNRIHTLDISGSTPTQSSFEACSVPRRVSIGSDGCNAIVSCAHHSTITEYTPDGTVVRIINVTEKDLIQNTYQAVELPDGRFVVGGYVAPDFLFGICIIDVQPEVSEAGEIDEINFVGTVANCFNTTNKQMRSPTYFAVDRYGNVIVSMLTYRNQRVVLLDSSLKYVKDFIPRTDFEPYKLPGTMFLDEDNARLYLDVVYDFPLSYVAVFNVEYE